MYSLKNDKFKKARGGHSRVLEISCEGCENHLAYYQKDGPGMLKRMYVDRFIDTKPISNNLECQECHRILGILITYEKEKRLAYRLFAGAITKKTVSRNSLASI